jgi:RNA polymerase sigma factor for flagellar operon FliA
MQVEQQRQTHDVAECWRRFKEHGDDEARNELILAYSPLVKYVAGRMGVGLPVHVESSDLVSYGLLGLINALDRYDPSRNIKFETYAVSRIKGAIIDELRAMDWVPRSVRSWARRIERCVTLLENRLGRAPSDDEMAAELEISTDELHAVLNQISHASIVALDEFWSVNSAEPDKLTLIDTLEDVKAPNPVAEFDLTTVKERLAEAIRRLPERERIVIGLYYYEGLTLKEIGEVLGVTESRVSQLHTKAILRLKGRLKDHVAPDSLGQ